MGLFSSRMTLGSVAVGPLLGGVVAAQRVVKRSRRKSSARGNAGYRV